MSGPDDSLRQVEALIAALNGGDDSDGRRMARQLLQVVLDLHGLALARMAAMLAAEPGGAVRLARLAEDPHMRAVLLLYGLHPEDAADRVARAIDALNDELAGEAARVSVVGVTTTAARLRVQPGRADPATLYERIEAAVVEAAPELEHLNVEGLDCVSEEAFPALAG